MYNAVRGYCKTKPLGHVQFARASLDYTIQYHQMDIYVRSKTVRYVLFSRFARIDESSADSSTKRRCSTMTLERRRC